MLKTRCWRSRLCQKIIRGDVKVHKLLDMDLTCNNEASENSPLFIVNVGIHITVYHNRSLQN